MGQEIVSNSEEKEILKADEDQYWAFISYSSRDKKWGAWLHKKLESYPIPKEFQKDQVFDGSPLGKKLRPIFRDRDELSGSSELGPAILKALQSSRFLVVLCSPNSAQSAWVNKEIEDFKSLREGNERRILALILEGEPNASSNSKLDNKLECFPPALRYPLEPLAGDLRKEGDGKERGFLKVLAGITQLKFDTLFRRHERAQQKKRFVIGAAATIIIGLLAGLSFFAFKQKNIADERSAEANKQKVIALENEKIANAKTVEANEQRDLATKQTTLARKRLAHSFFMTANEKFEQNRHLDGIRDFTLHDKK